MQGLVPNALSIVVSVFIRYGFKRIASTDELTLEGSICEGGICFDLQVTQIDPSFQKLPSVKLLSRPSKLPSHLPHVERDNKLCYLDKETVFLDPYNPKRSTLMIIGCIKRLLSSFVHADAENRQQEYAGEFDIYWESEYHCFLTTQNTNASGYFYERRGLSSQNTELIVAANQTSMDWWFSRRRAIPDTIGPSFQGIIIQLRNLPSIPDGTSDWPVKSLKTFLLWLHENDRDAEHRLLYELLTGLRNSKTITIILRSDLSGPFGVYVRFDKGIDKLIQRFSTKYISKKSKKNTQKKGKQYLTGLKRFRFLIHGTPLIANFKRLSVTDVSEEFVLNRNLESQSLRNRKIALIGCGTVGSFAADLLVKAGAGSGTKGEFRLYDGDILSGGNLCRHVLGIEYLNELKGPSMASYLQAHSPVPIRVIGKEHLPVRELGTLQRFDLIIDATGDENYSTLLAHRTHNQRREGGWSVPVLHSWVDAGGKAVRALLDDGHRACYRCLLTPKAGDKDPGAQEERFPLYLDRSLEDGEFRVQRCGDSYMPFPAGVSAASASMVQLMALEAINGKVSTRFRHQGLDPVIRKTKNHNPERNKACPCCQYDPK